MKQATSVEDFSYASNEANIKISMDRYLKAFGCRWFKKWKYARLLSKGEQFAEEKYTNNVILRNYFALERLLQSGDAIAAAVINPEAGIIATYTSLGMYKEMTIPVIQLTKTDMAKLKGLNLKVGAKLVAVATYLQDEGNPAATEWKTYKSILPYAYAANTEEIVKAFNGIPESKWKEFTYGLSCIPDKNKLGMYKINLSAMNA